MDHCGEFPVSIMIVLVAMGRLHDVKFSKTTKVHIGDIVIEEMSQQILMD